MAARTSTASRRKTISLKTKIQILDRLASGEGSTLVGKCFNINESTIRTIKKNEESIRQSVISGSTLRSRSSVYTRDIAIQKMEKALLTWIEDHTRKRKPIEGSEIKKMALKTYKELKELEPSTSCSTYIDKKIKFVASNGWLQRFLERNAIHTDLIREELVSSANEAAAQEFPDTLRSIIEAGGYCDDQVFNADEFGVFWKRMPKRSHIAISEKRAGGYRMSRDRISVLLCSNASGDCVLKPLMINRSLRPRAMQGVDLNNLPVHWMANRKAWVTPEIFRDWFYTCFVVEAQRYMTEKNYFFKVILILDNVPGHPHLDHPNVQIVYLPPKTTTLIQPLDQGIFATFKLFYIKRTFQYILNEMCTDSNLTAFDAWKQFSIRDSVNHAALASSEITPLILNSCWKNIWPACVRIEADNYTTTLTNVTDEINMEIISMARRIGGEGFDNFGIDDINEMITDRVLNEEELLEETIHPSTDSQDSSDDNADIPLNEEVVDIMMDNNSSTEPNTAPTLSANVLLEGLQIANQLAKHFLTNDPDTERAKLFHTGLKSAIAGYKELYKESSNVDLIFDSESAPEKKIPAKKRKAAKPKMKEAIKNNNAHPEAQPQPENVQIVSSNEIELEEYLVVRTPKKIQLLQSDLDILNMDF